MILRGFTTRNPREALLLGSYVWMFPAVYLLAKFCIDFVGSMQGASWRPMSYIVIDTVLAGVCIVCSAVFRKLPTKWANGVVFPFVVVGVGMLAGGNIASADASAGSQMFYLIPTVYAAYTLRKVGAVVSWVVIVTGVILNSALVSPFNVAVLDSIFVTAVVTLTMFATQGARNRSDAVHAAFIEQAQTDPLTGLKVRQVLDSALLSAVEGGTEDTVLLIVDCDNFKQINDAFGHPTGDEALRHVARVLSTLRPDHSVAFRIGGDEFAVLAHQCTLEEAQQLAEGIVQEVMSTRLHISSAETLELSVSVGVAHFPAHANDVEQLYLVADSALYVAKRGGRCRAGFPEQLKQAHENPSRPIDEGRRPSA